MEKVQRKLAGSGAVVHLPSRGCSGGENVTIDLPNGSVLVIQQPLEEWGADDTFEPVVELRGADFLHDAGVLKALDGGGAKRCRAGWLAHGERLAEYERDEAVTVVERKSRDGTLVARFEFTYEEWDGVLAAIVQIWRQSRLTQAARA